MTSEVCVFDNICVPISAVSSGLAAVGDAIPTSLLSQAKSDTSLLASLAEKYSVTIPDVVEPTNKYTILPTETGAARTSNVDLGSSGVYSFSILPTETGAARTSNVNLGTTTSEGMMTILPIESGTDRTARVSLGNATVTSASSAPSASATQDPGSGSGRKEIWSLGLAMGVVVGLIGIL